ncbi:MAG: hydroxymethylglutaryl-CoA reductase, degradative [Anaerolineales bacterium]
MLGSAPYTWGPRHHARSVSMSKASSRFPGFYELSLKARLARIAKAAQLDADYQQALSGIAGLTAEQADNMIENAVGVFGLPLGVAVNFIVNGRQVVVPMAIEEPSVVAGASHMAKLARAGGGFHAEADDPVMIGQIQVIDVPDLAQARARLEAHQDELLAEIEGVDPVIKELGGGPRGLEIRLLQETAVGPMLVLHVLYDTRDAMGANVLNTATERLAPRIEGLTGGRVVLRILSNLADQRLARARCRIPLKALAFDTFGGEQVRDGIITAWAFAEADPYRAATHNKGIMNGVDAVVIATGNDWRAVEAGAHAYAARSGRYTSLSRWWAGAEGNLEGELELPLAVGIVGGATRVHATARACLALMGVGSAKELAQIIASVGLAQNLAALRALSTEGIQRGHMGLHARQVAIAAGAQGDQIEKIAQQMVMDDQVRLDRAQELLQQHEDDL